MAATTKKRKRLETTLAAGAAHPIRSKCLVILAERVASPAEIARQLHLDVSKVGYHVNALSDANLIEEIGSRPVRGAVEHFYRAVQLPIVSNEQEAEFNEEERRVVAETILSIHADTAAHSLDAGPFLHRAHHPLPRLAFNIDEEGWEEATAAYMELYERIFEIQEVATE